MKTSRVEWEGENRPVSSPIELLARVYPLRDLSLELRDKGIARISGPGAAILFRQLRSLTDDLGGRLELKDPRGVIGEVSKEGELLLFRPGIGNGLKAIGRQKWLDHANKPLFDAYRQSGVAGLWLAESSKKDSELIGRQLSFGELAFSTAAYLTYRDKVQLTQKLYGKVGYLAPAFQELNAGIFRHQSLDDAKGFVEQQLVEFIQRADELHLVYAGAINDHFRSRRTWFQRRFLELTAALNTLKDKWNDWSLATSAGNRKKRKELLEVVNAAWLALRSAHEEADRPPFQFEWAEPDKRSSPKAQEVLITTYEQMLKGWNEKQRAQIREEQLGLNATTDLERQTQWNGLYTQMTELIEAVNNSGLFQRPLAAGATTVPRQQKIVEQLLEKLRLLKRLFPDFPAFYRWQHHWFSLEAELRRVISPLLVTPTANWVTAFSAWYFENGATDHLFGAERTPHFALEWNSAAKEKTIKKAAASLQFAIVTDPEEQENAQHPEIPTLLLCEPGQHRSGNEPVHYLSRYGHYQPGLAFVQEWTSYDLPDWKCADSYAALDLEEVPSRTSPENESSTLRYFGRVGPEASLKALGPKEIMGADWFELILHVENFPTDTEDLNAQELALILPHLWACAKRLRVLVEARPDQLTNALLSDGFSGPFALAATVRASEAIIDNDRKGFEALALEVRKRLGAAVSRPDPMVREILPTLRNAMPDVYFQAHVGWRDLYLPLVAQMPGGRKFVLLPDDLVPGADTLALDDERRRELSAAGFTLLPVFTSDLLTNVEATILRLVAGLRGEEVEDD